MPPLELAERLAALTRIMYGSLGGIQRDCVGADDGKVKEMVEGHAEELRKAFEACVKVIDELPTEDKYRDGGDEFLKELAQLEAMHNGCVEALKEETEQAEGVRERMLADL